MKQINHNRGDVHNTVNISQVPHTPVVQQRDLERSLVGAGLICMFFISIAAGSGTLMVATLAAAFGYGIFKAVQEKKARAAKLNAHADYEQAWAQRGDPRGTYGQYPPDEAI